MYSAVVIDDSMHQSGIVYAIPRYFTVHKAFKLFLALNNNDLFVYSGDIGVYLYKYDADTHT